MVYLHFWCLLCFGDVVVDMDVVPQLDADFDDVETHLYHVLAGCAVVPGAHVALESVLLPT